MSSVRFIFAAILLSLTECAIYDNSRLKAPKCCPQFESLKETNGNFTCEPFLQNNQIVSTYINFADCVGKCVDFTTNGTLVTFDCNERKVQEESDYIQFPKCCSYGHDYNSENHGCDKSTKPLKTHFELLKVSMSQCPIHTHAIVDYITDEDKIDYQTDYSIRFNRSQYFQKDSYCLDFTTNGKAVVRSCEKVEDVCSIYKENGIQCIRKCCVDGEFYLGPRCKAAPSYKFVPAYTGIHKKYALIQSPKTKKILLDDEEILNIDSHGSIKSISDKNVIFLDVSKPSYCFETLGDKRTLVFKYVVHDHSQDINFRINSIFLGISCVFLSLTIIGFIILPNLMNKFGFLILCYCLITLAGFLSMEISINVNVKEICVLMGFIIMFTFLGSFTWLNIICFDMYMAFGTMKLIKVGNKRRDRKRFIFYNLYGWGVPTVLTLITYVIYKTDCVPDPIKPVIGRGTCFFQHTRKNGYDHLLYFVLPLTILIVCNAVLFLKTIIYYFKVKTEINTMNDNYATDKEKRFKLFNADREKMIMLMKLFLVMGISWMFEVVSDVISFKSNSVLQVIEIIWDSFNSLQGLFIFCIFMVKAKTWEALKKKFCPAFGRRRSEHSSATLGTTLYSSSEDPRSIRLMSREKSIEKD